MSNGFISAEDIVHGALTHLTNGIPGPVNSNTGDIAKQLILTESQVRSALRNLETNKVISSLYIEGTGNFSTELLKAA